MSCLDIAADIKMDFKVLGVCVMFAVIHGLGTILGMEIPQPITIHNNVHPSRAIVHQANVTPSYVTPFYVIKSGSGGVTRIIRRIHRESFIRPDWLIQVELVVVACCSLVVIGLLGYFGRTCYKRLTDSNVRGTKSRQSYANARIKQAELNNGNPAI